MNPYKDKIAFVTGAASGIGYALTEALLSKGAKVMMADVDGPGLEDAIAKLGGASDNLSSTLCDVRDLEAVKAAADLTVETFGGVNIVMNNAGVGLAGRSGKTPIEDWRWIVDINLMGVVHGVEVFTPLISKASGGFILNTASMAGHMTTEYMPPYHATKFAVVGYTESIAQELAKKNITVTTLCPTWVKSNIAHSGDNRPSASILDAATSSALTMTQDLVSNGMEASCLADLTLAMMAEGRLHVFNDPEARPMIDIRAKSLAEDYDAALAWLETHS
ncbi:SDR family oxidoreductase [Litorimonas sp. WD9-15]|uniref:SDR family oxidoreductase n=1 Tax=Litorimonas sp. WD9-15 TaxID=3418716 RepID=UPI003D0641DB